MGKKLSKRKLKLIAKVWIGSIAYSSEGGFISESVGLSEDELSFIVTHAQEIGVKMCGAIGTNGDLEDIVKKVKSI